MLLPACLTGRWFTGLDEQIFNQLGGLHLIQSFDADAEELLGQFLGILFGGLGIFGQRKGR